MKFSIVTPSFRNSEWLKLCIASVADQDIPLEHIVQDSCSDDGTGDWLPRETRVRAFIEKDRGMYDAVNRGFRRAEGELLAYINCDEQYLPGTLKMVASHFDANPQVDIVFADAVVVDAEGRYLCDRKALLPQKYHTMVGTSLSFLTCSTFMRRRLIRDNSLYFNDAWRDIGDVDWALKLIASKARMAVLRDVTTAFTDTGTNMSLLANARREAEIMYRSAPKWAQMLRPWFIAHYRLRKLFSGAYRSHPYDYAIFTKDSPTRRNTFRVNQPTFRWVRKQPGAG